MFLDIYIICFLFFVGILFGLFAVIIGLKGPLKEKTYANTCDYCNMSYTWYELIPVASYFLNKGKCPYCNREATLFYPILELISGLLFSFSYMLYGFSYEMLIMILLIFLGIIIYVSDFKYYIIMDLPLIVTGIIILVLKFIFFGLETLVISFLSGFLIFLLMIAIRFIGNKIFKQDSLGGGDIKLSMLFGFMLGLKLSIVALIIGSFLAFPYALYCSLNKNKKEIPFGPFLITGLFIVFVFMGPIGNFLNIIFG